MSASKPRANRSTRSNRFKPVDHAPKPNLRHLRLYFNQVLDFAVLIYSTQGPGISNPDKSARRKVNSFKLAEFTADLDNALTYAVKDSPHIEAALYRILKQKAGLDDPTLPPIPGKLFNLVVKTVTPVLKRRGLDPYTYFNRTRGRLSR